MGLAGQSCEAGGTVRTHVNPSVAQPRGLVPGEDQEVLNTQLGRETEPKLGLISAGNRDH